MAARAPTHFTQYIDENAFRPRQYIKTTEAAKIADDQTYVLDAYQLVVSDCWYPISTTSAVYTTIRKVYAMNKFTCGDSTTANMRWSPLAWASAGVTDFYVQLYENISGVNNAVHVTTNLTTKQWRGDNNLSSISSDGTECEFELKFKLVGAGTIYCAGLLIYAL